MGMAKSTAASARFGYWRRRSNLLYYQVVRILASGLAEDAESVLDVGSSACPYLDWFPSIPIKTSLDLRKPYVAEGVQSVTGDFLDWELDRKYDLVLCLQVLEHVPDAQSFARKLLAAGKIVLVSVPFRWPPNANQHHVHDPVTLEKVVSWFGRKPNFSDVVREPIDGYERLVCVFDKNNRKWSSLSDRAGNPGFRPARGIPPFRQGGPAPVAARFLVSAAGRRLRALFTRR